MVFTSSKQAMRKEIMDYENTCTDNGVDNVGLTEWVLMHNGACFFREQLFMIGAHHRPILLDTDVSTEKVKWSFIFYKRWVKKDGCEEVVRSGIHSLRVRDVEKIILDYFGQIFKANNVCTPEKAQPLTSEEVCKAVFEI
ncbi:hypothetical protein LIER_00759 [Lithospermum erythrorhizon]|uniref:Uncharacterized protein n=1 Tax=Lithospermum erythrorhizon TaxID=34254 RepID=A0AAV3NNA7_LITER